MQSFQPPRHSRETGLGHGAVQAVDPKQSVREGTTFLPVKGGWWEKAGLQQPSPVGRAPPFCSRMQDAVAYGVVAKEQRSWKH